MKDNIVKLTFKEKKPSMVIQCGVCDGQLFYVEQNPQDYEDQGKFAAMHRCFRCGEVKDFFGLFWDNDELSDA